LSTKNHSINGKITMIYDPVLDLEDKTSFSEWDIANGKDIPFLFAYTAVVVSSSWGVMFTLGVVDRQTESFVPLHESINICTERKRYKIMIYVLTISGFGQKPPTRQELDRWKKMERVYHNIPSAPNQCGK